ncbi:hypothetical protein [Roseovarius ramblicola]|uniref:Uncharacterized protein n=1 Tax=Roseovarius ramblicola TaxID=2022336 RepID=A0ABV5I5A5_9RHOB
MDAPIGSIEALTVAKELTLQLMLMAAGVFALVAGFFGTSSTKITNNRALGSALVMFGLSILSGYIAQGAIISTFAAGAFDVYNPVMVIGGFGQLVLLLVGGGCLTYFVIKHLEG